MRSGAIRARVWAGGARSCGRGLVVLAGARSIAKRRDDGLAVAPMPGCKPVEPFGFDRVAGTAEWAAQSCGAALSVKLLAIGSSSARWQSPSGTEASAALKARSGGAGQHSNPHAKADTGD